MIGTGLSVQYNKWLFISNYYSSKFFENQINTYFNIFYTMINYIAINKTDIYFENESNIFLQSKQM